MMIQMNQNTVLKLCRLVVSQYKTFPPKGVLHYTRKKALYFSESVLTLAFC